MWFNALKEVATLFYYCDHSVGNIISDLDDFIEHEDKSFIYAAIEEFINNILHDDCQTAIIEVSKQYEEGAIKYGERNWEKGIPMHSYIDSGVRHLLKHTRGDIDEPHDRAFIWNMLGLLWTLDNRPDLNDLKK